MTLPANATDFVAERHFLGACMREEGLAMSANLSEEDFSQFGSRLVWRAMTQLSTKGANVNPRAILAELESMYDAQYSEGVDCLEICYSTGPEDSAMWLARVHEARAVRQSMEGLDELRTKAQAGMPAADMLHAMEQVTETIGERAMQHAHFQADEALRRHMLQLYSAQEARERGEADPNMVPTGITTLDKSIGGIPRGPLTVLAARPGEGKTAFLLNLMARMAKRGERCMYVSNEDTDTPLVSALIAIEARINRHKIAFGNFDNAEWGHFNRGAESAREWAKNITVSYVHGLKAGDISRRIRAAIRRHSVSLIALDYIQNVPSPERGMQRTYAIEENLSVFEELAATEKVAFIVGCQIGRGGEEKPTMRDLKDSGSLEQKAKLILAIHADERQKQNNAATCEILKQGQGETGPVQLRFVRKFALIEEPSYVTA